jgi:hypothetical protein
MLNCDVEDAGLETLLAGLKHPAYCGNGLFKALYAALSLEWVSRQTKDDSPKPVELPKLGTLTDEQLKECAGFLYGFCCLMDAGQYPRTFAFSFALFAVLIEEIDARSPAEGATLH